MGLVLAAIKLVVGYLGRSRALIGSGMCNLSDITSALAVLFGTAIVLKPANPRYQYGLGKLEFIVQISMSGLMIAGTLVVIFSSFLASVNA